ncbi:MAG: enoyl-CoA hydratase/isomerase family protein [Chloroflexota bacterium]
MALEYAVKDHVAYITLNRPEKMNAQNREMRIKMVDAWHKAKTDPDVWAVIITGNGKAFSAGHDLSEDMTPEEKASDPGSAAVYEGLMELDKPVIAAINGVCLAQGAGVALLTDIRIAADHVEFGWPQVRRGIGSVSGPAILSRAVPRNIAYEYLFTGEFFSAQRAHELHLVNHVVPGDQVMAKAEEIVDKIRKNAPLALRGIKQATIRTEILDQADAFRVGSMQTALLRHTEDAKEGVAAFREKREPQWKAR